MKAKVKTILKAVGIGAGSLGLMGLGLFMDRFWVKEKIHSYVSLARTTEMVSNEIKNRLDKKSLQDLSPEEKAKNDEALTCFLMYNYQDKGVKNVLEKLEKDIAL